MSAGKSQGTTLHVSNENAASTVYASATFAKVGQIRSISEPDGEASEIDTTTLDSTGKEFLMGLPDNGKITLGGFSDDADLGQIELEEAKNAQQLRWIKITLPTGAIRYFKAVCLRFSDFAAEPDGALPFTATLRISGAITRVAA